MKAPESTSRRTAAFWGVAPRVLTDDQRTTLQKWLPNEAIESLLYRLSIVRGELEASKASPAPSATDVTRHLQAIGEASAGLADLLENSAQRVRSELGRISHQRLGDRRAWRTIAAQLRNLSGGIDARRSVSDGGHPLAFCVGQVADIVVPLGIPVSASSGSRFYKVCEIAFEVAGKLGSPRRAIEAYQSAIRLTR